MVHCTLSCTSGAKSVGNETSNGPYFIEGFHGCNHAMQANGFEQTNICHDPPKDDKRRPKIMKR